MLAACAASGARPGSLGGDRFAPCPSAPHCVNSQDPDDNHRIAPLELKWPIASAWPQIVRIVQDSPRTTIVEHYNYYLHAEVVSPWHFYTDDLELFWDAPANRLQARSSSRVGYYDFHVNRERIEALWRRLVGAGVAAPP